MRNKLNLQDHLKLSIKLKVTIWYTCFIALITLISIIFLFSTSNKMTNSIIKEKLVTSVERARVHVNYNKDSLDISSKIENIQDAIILVYDNNKNLIYGKAYPTLEQISLIPNEFQKIDIDDNKFYIYDYKLSYKNHDDIYLRGIIPLNSVQIANNSILKLIILTFPILIILSSFGGYLITKKAFKPINNITSIANKISEGNDLSKRINIYKNAKNKDEITNLAETFNNMFERLHKSFEKERQFTSDASHELRTPTSVIMAQAEYLLSICETEKELNSSSVILKQSKKMSKLISELLMIARMDNNKQIFNFESFNFSEVVSMVIEELEFSAKEKNITISAEIQDNIYINADETMIMRVLINLISNAIKYNKNNGIIRVTLSEFNNKATIKICDNGIGISKENLEKIWDRFYQVDPSKTNNDTGSSGLGLSIVKSIVDAHEGKITVQSTLGSGSEFSLELNTITMK